MEEDWNALAADCIVVSCCCQCLVLQIIVFVLLRLPCKLIRKTKELARRRLARGRKRREKTKGVIEPIKAGRREEPEWTNLQGLQVKFEDAEICMKEVERALGELVDRGEFAFGSFWGRGRGNCPQHVGGYSSDGEFGFANVVKFHLIEIVNPCINKT
ncbi:hypothetical protein SAY86_019711 [Trapa natans]|uniref:Uncharacterized protein n=1 Tax=Trapa natans TaxID=22666 RepID=A0AAN7LY84_TRANT|nr:hypothetical protein SAY86_019711 [Trapa natans]